MEIFFILFLITTIISILWVRGIDYMKKNYPNYKGHDLFDDEYNKNKTR
jgi:hypothetical protein